MTPLHTYKVQVALYVRTGLLKMKTVILHAYNICLNIMPFNKPSSAIPPQPPIALESRFANTEQNLMMCRSVVSLWSAD